MKCQNLKEFEQSIGSFRIFLIILPSDQERVDLFQKVIQKMACTVERFTSDLDCRQFFDALLSPSLFGGETLCLLDECEALKKKEADSISEFLEKNLHFGMLLLGSRGKTPLSKIVEKKGLLLDMSEEKPWEKEKRIAQHLSEIAKQEGKWLSSDASVLLIEKLGTDLPTLSQEIHKLICFVGDRKNIERTDIFRLSSTNISDTPWQMSEEIIWEGGETQFDHAIFVPLIFSLRSQLQIGMKMASLMDAGIPFSDWSAYFPKMWPKMLEKRREQVLRKGSAYFKKGLDTLYQIETLSRSGPSDPKALYDFFRASMYVR
jgi:DNA polymerase III subunit delta